MAIVGALPTARIHNRDAVAGAREHVPDNSVDLVITDPPYGIAGDKLHRHYNRDESFAVGGYIDVSVDQYAEFTRVWVEEVARILRPGGSLYVVSGYSNLRHILNALHDNGLVEVNHIIWKFQFGVFTRRKFVSSHYHILYFRKPSAPATFNRECRFGSAELSGDGGNLNYRDREDVWVIGRENKPGQVKNKNELPIALLTKMVQYSSKPGDLVCDLFAGGGSTGAAAVGLGRSFVGFERNPNAFALAEMRLTSTRPWELFELRDVMQSGDPANAGKRWTHGELTLLRTRWADLRAQSLSKGRIVDVLSAEFKRGRWAITRALLRQAEAA